MKLLKMLFEDKYWLFFGSFFGGAIGALVFHLNIIISVGNLPESTAAPGLIYSIALGMIGGVIGGCVGSFIAGVLAHADVVFNIGVSLGIGLLNGFIAGVLTGAIMAGVHHWFPHLVSPAVMFFAIAVVVVIAFSISLFWKGDEEDR